MAFTMNKDRISLRGSADTPGPFSESDTGRIGEANPMADGPDGPADSGMAMISPAHQTGGKTSEYDPIGGGKVTEEYLGTGITRGGNPLPLGAKLTSKGGDKIEVIDENNSRQSTRHQIGKGVKIKRTKKNKTQYYPANHPTNPGGVIPKG